MINRHWLIIFFCAYSFVNFAQNTEDTPKELETEAYKPVVMDPLAPSKAAFYSAILPGLGQAVNKKYWKIPIVYAEYQSGSRVTYSSSNRSYTNWCFFSITF